MIRDLEIQTPNIKKMLSITKLLKTLLEMTNINLAELYKSDKQSIFEGLYKILNIILDDYDLEKNDYGMIGKQFFKVLSGVTDIEQKELEDFNFDDLHELLVKISVKLKEVKFINFFMKQIMISVNMIKG